MRYKYIKLLNTVGLLSVLAVNFLANYLPINNKTTGAVSDQFEVLFTPAGYVFSIWALIYLLLIGFVAYQFFSRHNEEIYNNIIGIWFFLSCVFNAAWIFAWHFEFFFLSLIIIVALLAVLIIIYSRLHSNRDFLTAGTQLLVYLPFSIYLAWISVATIANTAIFLTYIQWSGWGISPVSWTVIMLAVATVLAISISLLHRDLFFVLVFIWAFIGIAVKNYEVLPINYAVWFFTGALFTHCLWLFLYSKIAGPTFRNRLL